MQTIFLNKLTSPVRFFAAGTCAVLFVALTLCLSAVPARASDPYAPPIAVTGPSVLIGSMHYSGAGGGWFSGQAPLGGTFVVGANGYVIYGAGYGTGVWQSTPGGTQSGLAPNYGNSNAAGIDQYGNVYVARDYGPSIIKIPYNASTGQYAGFTTTPSTNCSGGTADTQACVFASGSQSLFSGENGGFSSLLFDGQGNFFFATDTTPANNKNTIYECAAASLPACSSPQVIYADTYAALGGVAVDPWGNLFFSDGQGNSSGNNTYVEELALSGGHYASTPTAVTTYNSAANYNGIAGVAISSVGTVYFSIPNDGIYAIPNSSSGPNAASIYRVSGEGGKGLTIDQSGNLYQVNYSNSLGNDGVFITPMGSINLGASTVGAASATAPTVTVIDSAANCTTAPTLTYTDSEGGVTTTEFTTAASALTCATSVNAGQGTFSPALASTGAVFTPTLSFTPAKVGNRNASLIIADSTNNVSGTAALAGIGQGAMGTVDPGVLTTFTNGLTAPASVVADPAGNVYVADSTAGKVFEFPAGSTASTSPTTVASGFTAPIALTFDANGDLFVADNGVPDIVEIPNTGTSGAFVAGTKRTIVSSSFTFGGKPLASALHLAVGPNGTLYISDGANSRVVAYNLVTGQGGITLAQATIEGLSSPAGVESPEGLAVDASGNLYIADSVLDEIFEVSSVGVVTTVTPPDVTNPVGLAVDASGSLIVSDSASDSASGANVVRIPSYNTETNTPGLTPSQAIVIATINPITNSLWMDWAGDLYVASVSGKTANVIMRNQTSGAAINLGAVADGATGAGTVYLENAGNAEASLATPDVAQSMSTAFTLLPATANSCTAGTSGPGGSWCAFTAQFAPTVGTAVGSYSGTADILVTTPSVSIPVLMSGNALASAAQTNTITWTPPVTGYIGQLINLSATSTAGYPVTFTSTTPSYCTVAGSTTSGFTATFVGAGACSITASLPQCTNTCQGAGSLSSTLYAAATPVVKSIAISDITATGVPTLIMNQFSWIYPSNSFTDGQTPQGGSFAITQDGEFVVGTTYNNLVLFINAQTGLLIANGTNPASGVKFNGPGGIAIDSNNNLYFAHLYNNVIYKLPYLGSGTYAMLTDGPTPAPPACKGGAADTAECVFVTYPSTPTPPNSGGLKAIAFDPSGNFYMVSEPSTSGSGQSYIYECNSSCQPNGTGTVLYSDSNGVSQISFDPWGNLFFTDANYLEAGSSNEGNSGASSSGLYEIPKAGVAAPPFTGTPTPLQTFTNTGTPGGYDDMLASVAVNPTTGTIYYGVLYDGAFAIPNTQTGGPVATSQYAVSNQGAKALIFDTHSNLYLMANGSGTDIAGNAFSGKDAAGVIALGTLTVPSAQYLGASTSAPANVVDNAFSCSTAANLVFVPTNADFSAVQDTPCSSFGIGDATLEYPVDGASSYPATITFDPLNPGAQTTTLTVSDTTNGGVGSATVSSFAETTPQTVTFTAPTTTTYTYAAPPSPVTITLTVANGGSNFPAIFSVDASSTGAGTFSNGLTTMTGVVTGADTSVVFTVTQAGTIKIDAYEPAGLASNHIYYSLSNTAQLALTINQASQTITFTPIVQSTYTYAPAPNQVTVQLSATGGATGNPVEFSIDPSSTGTGTITTSTQVGTASLATLTVTGAGSIIIDASQAGNVDYSAGSLTDAQTLTINQAAQTITLVPQTQPIHFIAASPGIAGGITVQVSAVGGGSDNPITFTLDASSTIMGTFGASTVNGATSTATLTIPLQGSVVSGTIVIDATQAQSTDYAAVTDTPLGSINILAPLALQLITFNNPGTQVVATPLTLAATASSNLPVSYISTTTSVCKVVGAAVTFASETSASSCTIVASQLGDNITWAAAPSVTQSFTVNPTGQNPNFSLNLSLATLTIVPGTSGLTQLTVTSSDNFTGSLALTCSGLPSGYTCTFNPNPITIAEGGTATTTITVTPPTTAAMVRHDSRSLVPVTALGVALCFLGFRKRSRLQLLLVLALGLTALGALSACGGTASTTSSTTSTTSTATITVTASGLGGASSSVKQSTTLTVIAE